MIKKAVILEVSEFLKQKGIVASESEFSEDWLGQCSSYFRGLRFKKTEPSIGVIAICASRLMNASDQLGRHSRYQQLAEQFAAMSDKCRSLVDADSVEFELATQAELAFEQ